MVGSEYKIWAKIFDFLNGMKCSPEVKIYLSLLLNSRKSQVCHVQFQYSSPPLDISMFLVSIISIIILHINIYLNFSEELAQGKIFFPRVEVMSTAGSYKVQEIQSLQLGRSF